MNEPRRSKNMPKLLGTWMITAAWLAVLGLLTLVFSGWMDKQHNPNQEISGAVRQDGAREVLLKRNRQGHYVATGAINGQETRYLLDTGATTVSVPEALARRLGLEYGHPMSAHTANGTITTYATMLDRVELGNIVLWNVRAHINPHMEGEEVLLGMSFLKELEFTQRGDTLLLRQFPVR